MLVAKRKIKGRKRESGWINSSWLKPKHAFDCLLFIYKINVHGSVLFYMRMNLDRTQYFECYELCKIMIDFKFDIYFTFQI